MEKFITAVFDSPDMADFARARLREHGVRFSRCETEPTHEPRRTDDLGVIINPYDPTFSNNLSTNWGSLTSANAMRFGGFVYTRTTGEAGAATFALAGAEKDVWTPKEVRMRLLVDDDDVDRAVDVLISCHAAHVRRE